MKAALPLGVSAPSLDCSRKTCARGAIALVRLVASVIA
jgi:hypothetical protein